MRKIRIIATPPGSAPLHIRQAWVGVEIPLASEEELAENPPSEVKLGSENEGGYVVFTSEAVRSLRKAQQYNASHYWEGFLFGTYLIFKKEVCEVFE